MKFLRKVIALALMVIAVSPIVPAYGATQQQPTGCHQHGRRVPVPNPATYQCCRAAHQFAAVGESVDFRTPFVPVSRVEEFGSSLLLSVVCPSSLKPFLAGSPGITSLRI